MSDPYRSASRPVVVCARCGERCPPSKYDWPVPSWVCTWCGVRVCEHGLCLSRPPRDGCASAAVAVLDEVSHG